jgi:hypothetical protein
VENPDVVLEVCCVDDKTEKLSYKVYNREKDDGASACEFVDIINCIFGNNESEDDDVNG